MRELATSKRPLVLGIGGGGDVVGALAVAEHRRLFLDVGGDALAHGHEPGLGSPLCDAMMLAAADILAERDVAVLGALFGTGCDGELQPAEVLERLAEIGAAGGLAGAVGITPEVA